MYSYSGMGGPLERSERGGEASTEQSEGDSLVATPGVPHRVIPNAQRSQQLSKDLCEAKGK